jgi:hypothetical protein
MTDPTNFRMERIEKLLYELRYEIERGMIGREIEEELQYRFVVPFSKHFEHGVVACEFRTRPVPRYESMSWEQDKPRLHVVKGGKDAG